jgi:hypothetical protein
VQAIGTTIIGSYADLLPGTLDPNQALYPGQVDGHGCIHPAHVPTLADQLDAVYPPNRWTHTAAWRNYAQDMPNQPSGREIGAPDPTGGLDRAHPPLNRGRQHQQRRPCWIVETGAATLPAVTAAGQRAGPGVRLALLAAMFAASVVGASPARAVKGHGVRLMPAGSGMTRSVSPKMALIWTRASAAPMQ